ncbi:MAG: dihydrofolate reductase family protein [Tabrizicola sp.]|uniref:dihydrofolate reductase family protein n=1 Tax=Tabrizicola sp. TaxID=2005166 RepID=UPI002AB99B6B|nr:dihydrofolate reductase family protein [Tabrizicola sp.]MDZ4087639.1 dihydrofolate reductase family protein [Tabrizicola sp.]
MTRVVVSAFSVSLDGFAAGPAQGPDHPLGLGGLDLHQWFFSQKNFPPMRGATDAAHQVDAEHAAKALDGSGAFIMGRHMFGPQRGPWTDDGWKGWWGPNPPWHAPTFILTHHPRDPIRLEGGTTFHFVTGGIHDALDQARNAAGRRNVQIAGGVATIRQYLLADLIDDLQLSFSPILLGQGEPLLPGIDLKARGFTLTDRAIGAHALHVTLRRRPPQESVAA